MNCHRIRCWAQAGDLTITDEIGILTVSHSQVSNIDPRNIQWGTGNGCGTRYTKYINGERLT